MDRVEVKSCHGRASLSMQVTSRASDETLFIATLLDPPFYGEVGASTYVIGPVSAFFCEMAEAWTGWDGAKRWASLDGELTRMPYRAAGGQPDSRSTREMRRCGSCAVRRRLQGIGQRRRHRRACQNFSVPRS